jgi:hypothetical protein
MASAVMAADKPNFSGEWKLDAGKSNFGPMPPPASMLRKVTHNDPALTIVEQQSGGPQGDQNITMKYTTDGKESVNNLMGNDVKSIATWEGSSLVIATKVDFQGNEIKVTDKWSLSDDGKVLTDVLHIAMGGQGEFDITYVLNRQ